MRKLTRTLGKGEVVSSSLPAAPDIPEISAFSISQLRLATFDTERSMKATFDSVRNPRGLIGVCSLRADQAGETRRRISRCIRRKVWSLIRPRPTRRSAGARRGKRMKQPGGSSDQTDARRSWLKRITKEVIEDAPA